MSECGTQTLRRRPNARRHADTRYFARRTYQECAEILGVSAQAVQNTERRALAKIRKQLTFE